jgi:hypothetical protein
MMRIVALLWLLSGMLAAQQPCKVAVTPPACSSSDAAVCMQEQQAFDKARTEMCNATRKSSWHTISAYEPPKPMSWHETFSSKTFWTFAAVNALATAGDEYMTLRGESHGCAEANQFGQPYHVSMGRMGSVDWPIWFGETAAGLLLRKVRMKFAPYAASAVGAEVHGHAMYKWARTGCM